MAGLILAVLLQHSFLCLVPLLVFSGHPDRSRYKCQQHETLCRQGFHRWIYPQEWYLQGPKPAEVLGTHPAAWSSLIPLPAKMKAII